MIKENASGINRKVDVVYPNIRSFTNKNFQSYINDSRKYIITKEFKDTFLIINPSLFNFNFEVAKDECLKLRIIFYVGKEKKFHILKLTLMNLL